MPRLKRHIEVREFEYLTRFDRKREGCYDLTNDEFDALREFVLENNDGESDVPLELMRLCSPPGIGEAFQLRNYVGVIELADGLQIEVLPKIDIAPSQQVTDREIFLKMLSTLGSDVSFKALSESHVSTDDMPLFEVFIGMFLEEATRLVRMGLKSAYIETYGQEQFVRGKIDFAREARKNPVHAERLNIVYDEFKRDRPENRLIKTTLLFLKSKTRSAGHARSIASLLPAFDTIGVSHNVDADIARCVTNRATEVYGTLLGWCRVFLKGESFTMFRGSSVATALLFPMERIFEDYVGHCLRIESIRNHVLRRVELQAQTQWLFEGHRIRLRPDILCEQRNGRLVVLDTKWKRVSKPGDLSVADMHQMYAYGQRYRCEDEEMQRVILLYPWHRDVKPGLYENGRHVSKDGVQVDMFFVDLANMDASMKGLLDVIDGNDN